MKQGDQAASNKDYSAAIAKYTRALEDNADSCYVYDFKTICQSGTYNGRSLHTAFVQTMLNLNTKLAITHLKRENHSRAYEWIRLALAQIYYYCPGAGAPPGGARVASFFSIAAEASEGLGLVERAIEEMKEALWQNPGDSKLTTELDRLKKKMQSGNGDLGLL